jgi:hypothetical protein
MERGTSILVHLESSTILVAIAPSLNATREDLGVNGRLKEIETTIMEEQFRKCNYDDKIPIRKGDDVEGQFYQNRNFTRFSSKLDFTYRNRISFTKNIFY